MPQNYEEMMRAKRFLPFEIGYLNKEHTEKAKQELNETEETRESALAELRNLVLAEETFTCPTDDDYLLQYLRARKFDAKKAFKLLYAFYYVRSNHSECFDTDQIDFERLDLLAKDGVACFLPYRSPDGCAILLLEYNKWDITKHGIIDLVRLLTGLLIYAAEDPATQVCGLRFVINVKGATFSHIRCVTPRYINLLSRALRNCTPIRFKGIHIFNESSVFPLIWSVFKLFITDKIKRRVHFHGDKQEQLHKFIPKEVLTEDYGGYNSYFKQGEWCSKMLIDFRPKLDILLGSGIRK